jgi:NADPH-dependent 2,4-dienoyl-CoA reductase/sulfur reductase-like enzyme
MSRIVVVGAGPAGIAAADMLVAAGMEVTLLDENRQPGGQGYRRPLPGLALDMASLMGTEAGKYAALHRRFEALRGRLDYRPGTLVWAVEGKTLHLSREGCATTVDYDALLLATGAMDRVAPCPGWTLPGVFTLGGAQIALKEQGCLIGRRTAFLGSSPLLALAAQQYRKLGGEVVAIADTTPFAAKLGALPGMLRAPRTLLRGLAYLGGSVLAGVPVLNGITPLAIAGHDRVEALRLRDASGRERRFACDAVALGYGLKPETQLAELAGATLAYDPDFRLWLPQADARGRAAPGLYLAGDGLAIGGADAAEASGAVAADAILSDFGRATASSARVQRRLVRSRGFQRSLARAFRWPVEQIRALEHASFTWKRSLR